MHELIIDAEGSDVTIALLEDKKLAELTYEKKGTVYAVGDIYLGRVKKTLPSLNAAFIDIGYEKEGFLHYTDLGPQLSSQVKFIKSVSSNKYPEGNLTHFELEPDIDKAGKINDVLAPNNWILVQIVKEPISTKGHRLSSEISVPGRFVVLTPFVDTVSISAKIKGAEERTRLRKLAASIKPQNMGIIVRTAAENCPVADLDNDVQEIVARWKACNELLRTVTPPFKVLGEMDRTSTILRDLLSPNFNSINVNSAALAEEIKSYLHTIAPDQLDIVKSYRGKMPIFEHFGVDKQIKSVFGKTVNIAGGAYLIIEHTEAMHVIDINSGVRKKTDDESQEAHAMQVNMTAAKEIARQLRLRDMGGIVVIDFIDMKNPQHRKDLYECLKEEMKRDRAKHTILPPSKFGIVQITRQRVRPETNIITAEKCPACDGSGEITASILLTDEIENNLRYLMREQNEKSVTLQTHPFVCAYLTKGLLSTKRKWFLKYKRTIKVVPNNKYHLLEYHFYNKAGDIIKI